ncbi:hypothetical protein MRX96_031374 [Rhipicephalus microplus]
MDCDPALLVCGVYEDLGSAHTAALLDATNRSYSSTIKVDKRLRDMNLQATGLRRRGNETNSKQRGRCCAPWNGWTIRGFPASGKWRKKTLVVAALRRAVEKGSSRQVRLERVAFFYCWLSSLNLLPVWTLFRFTVSVAKAGGYKAAHLVEHMASALKVLGHRTTFTVTEDKTAVYGCILVDDPEPRAPAHVICVCLWCKLPYMAVYAPNEKIHSDLGVLLAAVLDCDPRRQVCGIYDDLDSARTKALYDALLLSHGSKPVERSLTRNDLRRNLHATKPNVAAPTPRRLNRSRQVLAGRKRLAPVTVQRFTTARYFLRGLLVTAALVTALVVLLPGVPPSSATQNDVADMIELWHDLCRWGPDLVTLRRGDRSPPT